MSAAISSPAEARALLGLDASAGSDDLAAAFRAAAKQAHPDRPGGDAERFRQVVGAYRLLQAAPELAGSDVAPKALLVAFVEVGPLVALNGGEAEAVLCDGRRASARIPAGARHGEMLLVEGQQVQVRLRAEAAMQIRGSDLWITATAPQRLLQAGGRVQIETPLGPKVLWVSRKIAERRLVRLEGQGLPARAGYSQGSLFIRLAPDTGLPESPARVQLRRFAAAWAA